MQRASNIEVDKLYWYQPRDCADYYLVMITEVSGSISACYVQERNTNKSLVHQMDNDGRLVKTIVPNENLFKIIGWSILHETSAYPRMSDGTGHEISLPVIIYMNETVQIPKKEYQPMAGDLVWASPSEHLGRLLYYVIGHEGNRLFANRVKPNLELETLQARLSLDAYTFEPVTEYKAKTVTTVTVEKVS